ncbi:hypothetical protein B5X24_HaOG209481 [Helicoverpa armigera]|uniref:Uncharacterized protein n=1 Tax=Helicoverpa armigera TaxID=29058 RepID=A0A2W1BGW0_HELAM|nr:hypothetical protein B5X24_HaOG209481 [Helicoverpa armigera]
MLLSLIVVFFNYIERSIKLHRTSTAEHRPPLRSPQIPVGGDLHPASTATDIRSSVQLVGGRPTLRLLVRGL